jgi:hypothetical protein
MQINASTQQTIIEALELGMPIANVSDLVEIELPTIQQEMIAEPRFKAAVNKAIAKCMHERLQALKSCKNWQALAFILTSLWPARFGRNSKGVPKLAKLLNSPHILDFSRLDQYEQAWFDYLMAKLNGDNPKRPTDPGTRSEGAEPGTEAD